MGHCHSMVQLHTYQAKKTEDRAELIIGISKTVPKAEAIKKKQLCIFMYKCLHNDDICSQFKEYFKIQNSTANDMKIDLPRIKLEAARKVNYFQGAIIFNKLPEHTRKETDFRGFKTQLH